MIKCFPYEINMSFLRLKVSAKPSSMPYVQTQKRVKRIPYAEISKSSQKKINVHLVKNISSFN